MLAPRKCEQLTRQRFTAFGGTLQCGSSKRLNNCALPPMIINKLLKSCAMPPVNFPIASIFCATPGRCPLWPVERNFAKARDGTIGEAYHSRSLAAEPALHVQHR